MLPFRSGSSPKRWGSFVLLLTGMVCAALGADPKKSPAKGEGKREAKAKESPALGGIPLPIGQEIKGLVLPDFDDNGRMKTRFEAGTARRLDAERVHFSRLRVTTFTPESAVDLDIDMPESTLNMTTRVVKSDARTTIKRADFEIAGDSLEFDTNARKGTLVGNVKMVITDSSALTRKKGE